MIENRAAWAWQVLSIALLVLAVAATVSHRPGRIDAEDPRIYVDAAESILDGDYESSSEPSGVPRYPPGFPILLVPFVALWGDDGALAMSTLLGAVLVGVVWLAARRLGGPRAAVAAAVIWVASPMVAEYSTAVMSDPAAAIFVVLGFLAAMSSRWLLVGLAFAWSSWIRLIHVVFLLGMGRRRGAWLVAALALVPLAVFQLRVYGRLAGYDSETAEFSIANITGQTPLIYYDRPSPWPNWQFFPGLLWGLRQGLVPLLPLFAGFELFSRRTEPAARLAAWVVLANVAVYLPYYYQAPRFVLPAACLVIVFASAGVVRLVDTIRSTSQRGATPVDA